MNNLTVKDANGTEGVLLNPYNNEGHWVFRVHHKDGTFTDYDLCHSDLCVTINDIDAAFYEDADGNNRLDHSPETLGIKLTKVQNDII